MSKKTDSLTESVLKLLREKYGWDFYDTLTQRGQKLVKDTISALREVEASEKTEPDKKKGLLKLTKEQILNKWLNKY